LNVPLARHEPADNAGIDVGIFAEPIGGYPAGFDDLPKLIAQRVLAWGRGPGDALRGSFLHGCLATVEDLGFAWKIGAPD